MRIAKASHLKRLLQTQDAALSTFVYCALSTAAWVLGHHSLDDALIHLQIMPFVLLFSVAASAISAPKLHGQRNLSLLLFALRYTAIVVMGLLALIYFARFDFLDRTIIGGFTVLLPLVLLGNRLFLKWWYLSGRKENPSNYLKVLIIGAGNRARKLAATYVENSEWGVDIVGMVDPDAKDRGQVGGVPLLGTPADVHQILAQQVIDEVVVCVPRSMLDDLQSIVDACQEQGVCLKFMADVYDIRSQAVRLEHIGPLPVLAFDPVSYGEGRLVVKRIIDLVVTLVALTALAPLFAVIALAIKLDSPGSIFFMQERVGLNKRIFRMIKFRSMYVDAEQRLAEIEHLNEASGPIFKMENDPRVTRVGRWLRRTSIDELPQLFNVLLGHMSLIGPRPMSVRDVNLFSLGIQRRRFSVRPGLACLREVSGRSRLSFERWLELDLKYIDEWSLWLDIKIMFKLIPAVLRGDGAA